MTVISPELLSVINHSVRLVAHILDFFVDPGKPDRPHSMTGAEPKKSTVPRRVGTSLISENVTGNTKKEKKQV